ncbi:MAG: serine/threonine-protein kinase, partial [Ramlibacter sp.]
MNKLGKYQIRRPLGKGAMGVVYEGFDPVIERTVAIKTILPSQLNSAEAMDIMARFKREAQAAGRLNHPGIVAVYDYGEEVAQDVSEEDATMMAVAPASTQRIAYIAMEFVKGKELKEYLDKGDRFPLAEVARIMGEILDAMDHAHAQGVIHRDMKPANVMLLDGGRVKVADFGIARVEASELTQAGTVMGTPSYMSPEQFMGHTVDGRSDLFSCGVILYQLLTGERPFTGETSTTIMYKVLREEPAPPSALNLSLAPALDAVIAKALAKQPAQRFQNGRAFAAALRAAIADQQEALAPAAASQPQPAIATTAATTTSQAFAAPPMDAIAPPPRRVAVGAWVAAGAAAIAVVAGGYMVLMP